MLSKKRFVTALLVGAIGISLCATSAMAARTKDFVPIEEVWTEDTGILIYCSYYNDPEKVALDSNGKPLAVGISRAAIARTKGEYIKSSKDPMAWWNEGFSEDGFKQVEGSRISGGYSFTTAPDGTVYYGDGNNGGALTILHPNGMVKTVAGTKALYLSTAPDGKVWFDDYNHSRDLASYDPATGKLEYVTGAYYGYVIVAPDGKIWSGANNRGLSSYDPATGELERHWGLSVAYLAVTPDGKVWSGGSELQYYNPTTGDMENIGGVTGAFDTAVAPDGKLWFNSRYRGDVNKMFLTSYNPATGRVEYYSGCESRGRPSVAPDGKVWFADYNRRGQLTCYDPTTKDITRFSGINAYYDVHVDAMGNVWFADVDNDNVLTVYSPEKDQTRDW